MEQFGIFACDFKRIFGDIQSIHFRLIHLQIQRNRNTSRACTDVQDFESGLWIGMQNEMHKFLGLISRDQRMLIDEKFTAIKGPFAQDVLDWLASFEFFKIFPKCFWQLIWIQKIHHIYPLHPQMMLQKPVYEILGFFDPINRERFGPELDEIVIV